MIYTSYFGARKRLPSDARLVSIARGTPRWIKCDSELRLAPTREMLKLPPAEYDRQYNAILAELDPAEIVESLGEGDVILLCWERSNTRCHRRRVAEWLEEALGIVVPEFGLMRAATLDYADAPPAK